MAAYNLKRINSKIKEGIGLTKSQGITPFAKQATQYIFWELLGNTFFLPLVTKKFIKKAKGISSTNEAIEFAFNFNYFGLSIRPGQFKDEITKLLDIVLQLEPHQILEIGTAKGGTLFLFCRVSKPAAKIVSIDLPGGRFGGGYSERRTKLYRAFSQGNQKIILLRKNAHERSTLSETKEILSNQKLDFLFIDGDHTYEGVKKDFEMYSPLVRKGGIIAFHDIAKHPAKSKCEVNDFWDEIKNKYRFTEFINNPDQGTYGIGVIYYE